MAPEPEDEIKDDIALLNTYGKRRKMKQDIFAYLPSEIITEILSRLPVRTILRWKCVCKSWRHLFETHEFAKSHHSNSLVPAGIALAVESEVYIDGSVDGLLLLIKYEEPEYKLYLYNPITGEYIDLFHPQSFTSNCLIFGFGVSKITRQYKVVGMLSVDSPREGAKVYTIGTGSWRSIAPRDKVLSNKGRRGEFVNGNLYWLAKDLLSGKSLITCFDLETEIFNDIYPPFEFNAAVTRIAAMEDALCVCVCAHRCVDQIFIWLMKEYGDENSWTMQFIIKRNHHIWNDPIIYPIKFSKDGVILLSHDKSLYYYSTEDGEITQANCNFQGDACRLHSYTPSFLSPDCFKMENGLSHSHGLFKVNLHLDC